MEKIALRTVFAWITDGIPLAFSQSVPGTFFVPNKYLSP